MLPIIISGQRIQPELVTKNIYDPASGEVINTVPLCGNEEVNSAVKAAQEALLTWAKVPITERVALMFKFKSILEQNIQNLAAIVTKCHGKTLEEAKGEVRRGIDVVDFACSAPTLLQGRTLRDVSHNVDQDLYKYPVGVCAGITPFNFPVMIPLWMFPLAIVCGNTFILKPSPHTGLGANALYDLFEQAGFPNGVLNIIHGDKEAVDAILAHPGIDAISFVGSEKVAHYVYKTAAQYGKRVQALGGAKNHTIVMDDTEIDVAVPAVLNSAYGNAGERCLAGSVVIPLGKTRHTFIEQVLEMARKLKVGPGYQPDVNIGPLVTDEHRKRVLSYVEKGIEEGAEFMLDGRSEINRPGFFLGPVVLGNVKEEMTVAREEIFGPVLCVADEVDLESAIERINKSRYGNMAVIFTSSGKHARTFRENVKAGMLGVNVSIAQPFAFYPFVGWKNSFFGDLHAQGTDAIEFYTRKKVVVTRWP